MTTKWNVMLHFTFAVSPHVAFPSLCKHGRRSSHTDAGFNHGGGWGLTLRKVALLRVWCGVGLLHSQCASPSPNGECQRCTGV